MATVKFNDTASDDGDRANAANWFQSDGTTALGRVPISTDDCVQVTASTKGNVTCASYTTAGFAAGGPTNSITCTGAFNNDSGPAMTVGTIVCPGGYSQQVGTTGTIAARVNITGNVRCDVG